MANRRYYGDAGGNIGITFAPDESVKLNPAFDPSQDVSATNPVTMASKQGFLRKLLGGSGSAADAFNAEAALRQALTKQAFNNSMALQKMQDEAAYKRAMDLAQFKKDASIDAALAQEVERDVSSRRSLDQQRMIAAEADTRRADLEEQKRVRELIRSGQAAKIGANNFFADKQVPDEIAAAALRVAQGQQGDQIGASAYAGWLAAQNAANAAAAKYADPIAATKTYVSVSKDTAQFPLAPNMPPLFGESFEDVIAQNPYTKMMEKVGSKRVPASMGRSQDAIAAQVEADIRAAEEAKRKRESQAMPMRPVMGSKQMMEAESMRNIPTEYVHPIPDVFEALTKGGRYSLPIRRPSPYGF